MGACRTVDLVPDFYPSPGIRNHLEHFWKSVDRRDIFPSSRLPTLRRRERKLPVLQLHLESRPYFMLSYQREILWLQTCSKYFNNLATYLLSSVNDIVEDEGWFPVSNPSLYRATTTAPPSPRLCCRASFALSTCLWSAWPLNCKQSSVHWANPGEQIFQDNECAKSNV